MVVGLRYENWTANNNNGTGGRRQDGLDEQRWRRKRVIHFIPPPQIHITTKNTSE
jgi:hypothetical protein